MNLDGYLICQDMYHTFLESLLLEGKKYIYLFLNPILTHYLLKSRKWVKHDHE